MVVAMSTTQIGHTTRALVLIVSISQSLEYKARKNRVINMSDRQVGSIKQQEELALYYHKRYIILLENQQLTCQQQLCIWILDIKIALSPAI